eukprot:SAG22_NODE_43_length_25304_cov_5.394644_17_plen_943_part_00
MPVASSGRSDSASRENPLTAEEQNLAVPFQPLQPLPPGILRHLDLGTGALYNPAACLTPDGRCALSAGDTMCVTLRCLVGPSGSGGRGGMDDDLGHVNLLQRPKHIHAMMLSPDGRRLCTASRDGVLAMHDFEPTLAYLTNRDPAGAAFLESVPTPELLWTLEGPRAGSDDWAGPAAVLSAPGESDLHGQLLLAYDSGKTVEVRSVRASGELEDKSLASIIVELAGPERAGEDGGRFSVGALHIGPPSSGPLLAIACRGADAQRVRLFRGADFTAELPPLELAGPGCAVAVRPDGREVAVALHNGAVWLHPIADKATGVSIEEAPRMLRPPTQGKCARLDFSVDSRLLAVGGGKVSHEVYEVYTCAILAAFDHPGTSIEDAQHMVCAFASKQTSSTRHVGGTGTLIAGGAASSSLTLHELVPTAPVGRTTRPTNQNGNNGAATELVAATVHSDYTVLLRGERRVELHSQRWQGTQSDSDLVWAAELSDDAHLVAMRPRSSQSGAEVAVGLSGKQVSVRDSATGNERLRLPLDGSLQYTERVNGVVYSPDGTRLVVRTSSVVVVHNASTGALIATMADPRGAWIFNVALSPSGLLVTTGWPGTACVRRFDDAPAGQPPPAPVRTLESSSDTHGVCFDESGGRMAYCVDGAQPVVIVLDTDSWQEQQRFPVRDYAQLAFSPGPGELLLCTNNGGDIALVDPSTGVERSWAKFVRPLCFPPESDRRTFGWTPPSDSAAAGQPPPLLLHGAGWGGELITVDLQVFARAVETDGNIGMPALGWLADTADERAETELAARFPLLVNRQDPVTGETVLHHCIRGGHIESVERWLSGIAAVYTPIADANGDTALDLAIREHSRPALKLLIGNIGGLTNTSGGLVTRSLRLLAEEMPELVLPCLEMLAGSPPTGWKLKQRVGSDGAAPVLRTVATIARCWPALRWRAQNCS